MQFYFRHVEADSEDAVTDSFHCFSILVSQLVLKAILKALKLNLTANKNFK